MSRLWTRVGVCLGAVIFPGVPWLSSIAGQSRSEEKPPPTPSKESAKCVTCHRENTPVIVGQWEDSRHASLGVGCYECHQAKEGDVDAWQHQGALIATIVTPKDCGQCHEKEEKENSASHHAQGAQFVGSLDNILGEIVEGRLAAANGCLQCHGSTVAFQKDQAGKIVRDAEGRPAFDPLTWPNTGIGRVNLDGSKGSCSACHSRHSFTNVIARFPDNCGKCHMGPDHPQIEIYNESKHGIAFRARQSEMHLEKTPWVLGKDYNAAPTCSTCHLSATPRQPVTHDVGARISWTLRPVLSKKLDNWQQRRDKMKDVCLNCHGPAFVDSFYVQYDNSVTMYNEKFAQPAQRLMDALKAAGKITPTPFDDKIEWTFYHLWHHEGRRARMGASMQGPDYTQWHGFFEVAHRFYFELLPQAEELGRDIPAVQEVLSSIRNAPEHRWKQGLTPEQILEIQKFYQERYGQK